MDDFGVVLIVLIFILMMWRIEHAIRSLSKKKLGVQDDKV